MSASVDGEGKPGEIKLNLLDPRWDLQPDAKLATREAKARLARRCADPSARTEWIREFPPFPKPMKAAFVQARRWLVDVFNGIGTKYLQSYLDEYCFRRNTSARGECPREAWQELCC